MKRTFILGSVVLATVMVVGLLVVLIATGVIGTSSERLLFSSESAEAIYTGEPLTCEEWALKEGTLHEGHTAVATFQGSQTNAGTSENIFTVIIEDENGADVTDDYEIVYQPGTLKVIPCDLHLKADSAAKQYDGTPISATTYQIVGGKLLAGHYLEVTVDGSRTEVGQSDNVLSARVFNKDGEDVTANYNIITAMGDLTVTPHAITIQSGNASKVYDGTALTLDEISMRTGSLISGHNLVLLSTGTLTDAGTVKNTFAVEIQDSEGNNVTHNYTITTLFGELTVSRREMKIQSAPATKVYDGTPLTKHEYIIESGSVVSDHTLKIEFTGTQTNVGSDDNEYSAIVEDADGNDVTVNYQISTYCGKLVVTARPITVRSADASKDYDGDPLTCPDWSVVSITQIVEGHTLDVAVSGTRTEIGESENSIAEIKVTDANGEDVTRNYDFSEKQHGILTVKDTKTPDGKRPIVITAASSEHIYDGTTYTDPNYTVTEPGVNVGLAQGHTIEVVVQGEITNAGEADNLVTAVIIRDATSTIVYDSLNPANDAGIYEVTLKKGTLTVTPRQVFVVLGDATKLYDGTVTLPAPYDTSYTIYESPNPLTGLLTGHNLTATVVGSTANVNTNAVAIAAGDVWQTMLLKESISIIGPSGDMTENYEIVETYGKLTIQPRVLALTVPDVTKIYDGMSLVKDAYASLDEVQPTDGGLLPGHVLYAAVEGDRVDIGEGVAFVSPDNLRVEFEGVDLGGNYTYTETTGTVTILQRPITIKANDTIKVYDDKYDIPGGFTLSETLDDQGLVPGHVAEATVIGSEKICSTGGYTRVVESSVQILNGKTNVTANYKITYATGSLTITPRPVVITGGSAEKEYDGTPLVKNSVEWDPEVENAGLLLNHTITEWTVTGSCTEVGQEPNVVTPDSITIVDAYGNEVQGNYTFSYANGTLTVTDPTTPPPGGKVIVARVNTDYSGLVFLRQNSGGTYTGGGFSAATAYTGLIDDTFAMTYLTGLALGDASQTLYEMQIEVLRPDLAGYLMPGSPAVGVYYAETNDTMNTGDSSQAYTQGYYLLPVTDASALMELVSSLTLPTAYAADEAAYREFVYTNGQYTYVPQSTALAMQAFMEAKDLHADDPDIVSKVAQCIRAALSYNLEYDTALDGERDIAAAVVSGAYTEGVCRHYAVAATMLYRTLGIPARYTVGFAARVNAGEETYVTTDTAHAWVEIYIDGIGWVALDVTGGTTLPNPPDEEEEDPPQNAIEIRPTTLYMKYVDGTTVLKPQDMLTYGIGTLLEGNNNFNALLNKGYTYTVRYSGEQRTVGYGNSYIEEFHLFDPEGNEVTTTFVVTARAGRLHVYYEELTITSRPGGKEYDGTPLDPPMRDTGNGYFITGQFVTSIDGQAVIHQEVIELNASITNIGSMANYFTPKIIDATTGEDVTYMYKITCKYGLLTVKGREITVIAGSDAKTYDGEPLTCPTFTVEGILHKNHEIEVVTEGSVLLGRGVNTVKSVLIYDINDPLKTPLNDVYYQINTKPGTLRVTR